jgi:LPXTG-site transpeptidase (sortase) family protein
MPARAPQPRSRSLLPAGLGLLLAIEGACAQTALWQRSAPAIATPTGAAWVAATQPPLAATAAEAAAGPSALADFFGAGAAGLPAAEEAAARSAASSVDQPAGEDLPDRSGRTGYAPPTLVIPDLDLDQRIVAVDIANGIWDLEKLDQDIGWLPTTGGHPGDDLAMVLAGHVTVTTGRGGPFAQLRHLRIGDQVIYRAGGQDYIYAVESKETVDPEDVQRLYVPDGSRLLLLTCTNWSFFQREYTGRLLVTAKLMSTQPSPSS